jgi:hypothetical protein
MAEEQLIPEPPRKEDVLVRSDLPDWQNNACLNPVHGDERGYTEGYRRGAMRLVSFVMEKGREQDYLVYPIVFLYRHHIELILKSLLTRIAYVIDHALTGPEKEHLGRHRLDLLWQDLRPKLDLMSDVAGWKKLAAADIEGIHSHIRQLTALDPDSFSFRYTHNKKGAISLPPDLVNLNLRHFAHMTGRLADYLDTLDTAVGVLEEGKMEMEAEWRNASGDYA